mmetsp:Transcript_476/g.1153  ORF Transcript_476/g.1153 Transcript_476/m.1153 type:complete len:226 (-) Transcript_476:815-1492(-)
MVSLPTEDKQTKYRLCKQCLAPWFATKRLELKLDRLPRIISFVVEIWQFYNLTHAAQCVISVMYDQQTWEGILVILRIHGGTVTSFLDAASFRARKGINFSVLLIDNGTCDIFLLLRSGCDLGLLAISVHERLGCLVPRPESILVREVSICEVAPGTVVALNRAKDAVYCKISSIGSVLSGVKEFAIKALICPLFDCIKERLARIISKVVLLHRPLGNQEHDCSS